MFRINEVEISEEITLLKLEGEINKQNFDTCISAILKEKRHNKKVVMDFCGVSYIDPAAIKKLKKATNEKFLFLNCGTRLKNILNNEGLTNNLIS